MLEVNSALTCSVSARLPQKQVLPKTPPSDSGVSSGAVKGESVSQPTVFKDVLFTMAAKHPSVFMSCLLCMWRD